MNTDYYRSVYASLRGAMIDRANGDREEDAVLVDMGAVHIALKKEIPSSALLVAYSMLYYPGWMKEGAKGGLVPIGKRIEDFVGGIANPRFNLLFNIEMAMIAAAVGSYAGFVKLHYSPVIQTTMVNPNMESPIVLETHRLINERNLKIKDARDVFIDLMKQDDYAVNVPLADDYIANATFITENTAAIDQEYTANVQQVDFSGEFKGADEE